MTLADFSKRNGPITFSGPQIEEFADFCEVMPLNIVPDTAPHDHSNWADFLRGGKVETIIGSPAGMKVNKAAVKFGTGIGRNWYYVPAAKEEAAPATKEAPAPEKEAPAPVSA